MSAYKVTDETEVFRTLTLEISNEKQRVEIIHRETYEKLSLTHAEVADLFYLLNIMGSVRKP
jgi:hypothetical protein